MTPYRSALITDASSGIGEALAIALASPGVTLHLSGRDQIRLDAVATACRSRGATVASEVIDVRDAAAMQAWITSAGPLDLIIANAGISAGSGTVAGERLSGLLPPRVLGMLLPDRSDPTGENP